ncbi:MAG: tol-pal system protein YbgF [Gammaproteobacteria bacterium]|nr:tol-pal system protein YbgF [Gammaproteobacteria bacterium]
MLAGRFLLVAGLCVCVSVVNAAQTAQSSIEQRIARMERLLNNQNLIQMYTAQQALKQELSDLRGDVEVLNHEIEQLKKQQKDIYFDLDQRIQDLQKSVSSMRSIPTVSDFGAPSAGAAAGANVGVGAETVTPVTGAGTDAAAEINQNSLSEQESYQGGLALLKNGQYDEAIQAFQVFLISYPESTYASNAQYWMAEAYYVLKNFPSAISQFDKVISAYPDSRKVPDAFLKVGFSYYELKDWANAKLALEKVVTDYADSTAARLAQRRLQKMQLEGHI